MPFAQYAERGYLADAASAATLVPFGGAHPLEDLRRAGREPRHTAAARVRPPADCGGCSGLGRCIQAGEGQSPSCACLDGSHGKTCLHRCENDCFHDCSGRGQCRHGWCVCDPGWSGVDCSEPLDARLADATRTSTSQFGAPHLSPPSYEDLPPALLRHASRLFGKLHVYTLPEDVNRAGATELWSQRQWKPGAFKGRCDEVHARRVYSAEAHFDALIMRDRRLRAPSPEVALVFYVPLFLNQRLTWGASAAPAMRRALHHIKHAYPFWNRTNGRDHVWFVFGERMTCSVPDEIRRAAIVVGHWGDLDCMSDRGVVVPPVSPLQHDYEEFSRNVLPFYAGRHCVASTKRGCVEWKDGTAPSDGPLLFFAGGITSFGSSQDNMRKGGNDSEELRSKWLQRVRSDPCALPNATCRGAYSMGVRQAVWRSELWRDPHVRLVSAGVTDYMAAVPRARFCLHTEGNGFGIRLVDYMAMGCVPLIINDRMARPFENVLNYTAFAVSMQKREIPTALDRLRAELPRHRALRERALETRRLFTWYRPVGLAYEATIAAISHRALT